jgi:hypothetical protein
LETGGSSLVHGYSFRFSKSMETKTFIPDITFAEHSQAQPRTSPKSFKARIFALFQNLGTLFLLTIAFPLNLAVVSLALVGSGLRRFFQSSLSQPTPTAAKTILIAGARMTKTLQLARSFHVAGHRVILIDTEKFWLNGNQYSNTVAGFYTVPDPQKDLSGYTKALQHIAKTEKIDLFIPVAIFAVVYPEGMEQHPLADYCTTQR